MSKKFIDACPKCGATTLHFSTNNAGRTTTECLHCGHTIFDITFDELANKVADIIDERGYEFGTGRFRDVELVLEIAHALGGVNTAPPESGVIYHGEGDPLLDKFTNG